MSFLENTDKEVFDFIEKEKQRQSLGLEMIASENYTSLAVMEAQGSELTNKYAEGYPRKRYYGGCEFIDEIEQLAIDRARKLFLCEHANVQAHSGSQANMAAYMAYLEPRDKILGMSLSHGGHLTHGSPVNFSGRLYEAVSYELHPETLLLDYDRIRTLALKHKPKMIIAGYSAYPRVLNFKIFREICDEVGAFLLVDMAHFAGLVATKLHPSPIPYAHVVTSTTHKTLRGPRGGLILCQESESKKINSKIFPCLQGGPLEHVIAAKAVSFKEALNSEFTVYMKQVLKNAKVLAKNLLSEGFDLVTKGTDNHLILIDLTNLKKITGKNAEEALDKAGITVNKNTVPYEKRSPFITSGIRVGTPALTTRGMKENEMKQIAKWLALILKDFKNEKLLEKIRNEVKELCGNFPFYS